MSEKAHSESEKSNIRSARFWHSAWFNPNLLIGAAILLGVFIISALGPVIRDEKMALVGSSPTNVIQLWVKEKPSKLLKDADATHPLGTESNGRDMLAVLLVVLGVGLLLELLVPGLSFVSLAILAIGIAFTAVWLDRKSVV